MRPALGAIVLFEVFIEIVGAAHIERLIRTFENVDTEHKKSVSWKL